MGTQLWRKLGYTKAGTLSYYRTTDGAEVDFIIETENELVPVEVKWTENTGPERRPPPAFVHRGKPAALYARVHRIPLSL